MRIWSLHPKYLDSKGIVALWRETLLAKNVIEGKTKGYRNHPQLYRFKAAQKPLDCINQYLSEVYKESVLRGYNFDKSKIDWDFEHSRLTVTSGQVDYEVSHLKTKLQVRDPKLFDSFSTLQEYKIHPIFEQIEGGLEDWEIV